MELNKKLAESGITDIHFILWASSWGALSCVVETYDKKYQSWAGYPSDKVTLELLVEALNLALEQVKNEQNPR